MALLRSFFFSSRRRHTRSTRDWSSDVCSSDLAETARAQGAFWPMHDLLFEHQDALTFADLVGYARELGLDVDRFRDDLRRHVHAGRLAEDVESADMSNVSGTPTFFVNGLRHHGAYDIETLSAAVKAARARTLLPAGR